MAKRKSRKIRKCWKCGIELDDFEFTPIDYMGFDLVCSSCGAHYADKPKNEARLHVLQAEYLQTRNKDVLNKMMGILQEVTYNLIVSKLRNSTSFLSPDEINDRVQWTLAKLNDYYLRDNFKIDTSFIQYLRKVVLYPLYNYKQKDIDQNEESLFKVIGKDKDNKKENTIIDVLSDQETSESIDTYLFNGTQGNQVVALVSKFISSLLNISYQQKGFNYTLKLLILLNAFLDKPSNNYFNNWWDKEGLCLKEGYEKSLELLRSVLIDASRI